MTQPFTADEFARCKRAWESIREMESPARQSIAVALWAGLYAEELLRAAEPDLYGALESMLYWIARGRFDALPVATIAELLDAQTNAQTALSKARGEQP